MLDRHLYTFNRLIFSGAADGGKVRQMLNSQDSSKFYLLNIMTQINENFKKCI